MTDIIAVCCSHCAASVAFLQNLPMNPTWVDFHQGYFAATNLRLGDSTMLVARQDDKTRSPIGKNLEHLSWNKLNEKLLRSSTTCAV